MKTPTNVQKCDFDRAMTDHIAEIRDNAAANSVPHLALETAEGKQ